MRSVEWSRELWFDDQTGMNLHEFRLIRDLSDADPGEIDRFNAGYDFGDANDSFVKLTGGEPKKASTAVPESFRNGVFSRFQQYSGKTPDGRILARYSTMDFATYEQARRLKFEHPGAWNFLIIFESPTTQQYGSLGESMVFRRAINGYTFPLYNPIIRFRGRIVKKWRGSSTDTIDVDIPVLYTRNLGRFRSSTFWDGTLSKIEILEATEKKLLFRGTLSHQTQWGDRLFSDPTSMEFPIPQRYLDMVP